MAWQSEVRDAGLCPHSVHPGRQRLRAAACSRGSKNRYEYGEGVRASELAGPVRRGDHAGKQSAQAIFSIGPLKKGCATREEVAEISFFSKIRPLYFKPLPIGAVYSRFSQADRLVAWSFLKSGTPRRSLAQSRNPLHSCFNNLCAGLFPVCQAILLQSPGMPLNGFGPLSTPRVCNARW